MQLITLERGWYIVAEINDEFLHGRKCGLLFFHGKFHNCGYHTYKEIWENPSY